VHEIEHRLSEVCARTQCSVNEHRPDPPRSWPADQDQWLTFVEVDVHHRERQVGRARRVTVGHPGVTVFLDLDRPRPAVLDRVAEAVQRPDPRVAAIGEHQPPRHAHPDELVKQQIRRHPDQLELGAPLAQQLVAGGERDQVRETLERDAVPIVDELGDRLTQRHDLSHISQCSRSVRIITLRTWYMLAP